VISHAMAAVLVAPFNSFSGSRTRSTNEGRASKAVDVPDRARVDGALIY
jgi:hypothetical protein